MKTGFLVEMVQYIFTLLVYEIWKIHTQCSLKASRSSAYTTCDLYINKFSNIDNIRGYEKQNFFSHV